MSKFTFDYYQKIFEVAQRYEYQILTLRDYFKGNYDSSLKVLINRIDVDFNVNKARTIGEIFQRQKIAGSFFFRLHAPEYNLFAFENVNTLRVLIENGNEIGLHTELEDMKQICQLSPKELLRKEIAIFESFYDIKLSGTAAHGGMTGFNNLDFWKNSSPSEFGLLYEGYDQNLWEKSRYISDSEWTRWKAYQRGELIENDRRSPIEHIEQESPQLIYLLTHADGYYFKHFYE